MVFFLDSPPSAARAGRAGSDAAASVAAAAEARPGGVILFFECRR